MFQELQLSGLLCYGPLLLVIGGFIAFAAMTDRNARSTYLRRLDPRPDSEREPVVPVQVTEKKRVVTPSGMVATLLVDETAVATPVATRTAAAAVAIEEEPEPEAPAPDDLKRIEGIGPKINSILADAGIATFAQLAAKSAAEIRAILDDAGMSKIHDTTSWPEQASLAAAGDWETLEKLQDDLKGGRAA